MTNLPEWERQLQQELSEIARTGKSLAQAASAIRGRGEVRGLIVEVNPSGDITNLQIAPGAMRWSNTQMVSALLDCHRRARVDAATKVKQLVRTTDPRLRKSLQTLREASESASAPPPRTMTEEEIQAADDAYFDRMNQHGWTS